MLVQVDGALPVTTIKMPPSHISAIMVHKEARASAREGPVRGASCSRSWVVSRVLNQCRGGIAGTPATDASKIALNTIELP